MPSAVPHDATLALRHRRALLAFGAAIGCAAGTPLLTALVTLGWQPLERLDTEVVAAAVSWTTDHPNVTEWLNRIGLTSGKRVLWPLSAILSVILWLAGRRYEGVLMAAAIASTTVITGAIKRRTSRDRPDGYVPEDPLPTASFPSGHVSLWVAFVFALLMMLPLLLRPGRVPRLTAMLTSAPLLLLLAVISVQRVLQGRHFPSDVFAGVLVGAGCALACWAALAVVTQRASASARPSPHGLAEV